MIECELKGRDPQVFAGTPKEVIDKAETCYLSFLEWKELHQLEVLETEVHLVSERLRYGATPDCLAKLNGKLILLDWKTSKGVYKDMLLQLAAYKAVWEECHPENRIEGMFLLRIGKSTASFHHQYWATLPEAWQASEHCLKLHQISKRLKDVA